MKSCCHACQSRIHVKINLCRVFFTPHSLDTERHHTLQMIIFHHFKLYEHTMCLQLTSILITGIIHFHKPWICQFHPSLEVVPGE